MVTRTADFFASPIDARQADRDLVVLIHGLAAGRTVMRPLERHLQWVGFETINWGYRSILGDVDRLGQSLGELLQDLNERNSLDRIHLVTHSMGSIIARAALARGDWQRLGRVVMLGPPNRGSPVATRLAPVLGWFCKPLEQLSDRRGSYVNSLPQPEGHEIGVIAAEYDRVVRLNDTTLSTQADHIIVRSGHTSMLFRREVAELVEEFLRNGAFRRQTTSEIVRLVPARGRAASLHRDLAPISRAE